MTLLAPTPKIRSPLEDNGGPTSTHLPLDSPALDAGDNAVTTARPDDRSTRRPLRAPTRPTPHDADRRSKVAEADLTIAAVIPDQTFDEGGSAQVTFDVGD